MSANHLLDANIKDSECLKLAKYGLKFKHIGRDYWKHHFSDEHIISQLHQLNRATLVTRDVKDFYHRHLLHRNYCLLCLDIPEDAVATYTRRVYRHPRFNSVAQRCGKVIRVSSSRITYFELGLPDEQTVSLE
jgi:hypothetical protein